MVMSLWPRFFWFTLYMSHEFPQRCGRLNCELLYPYTLYFNFTLSVMAITSGRSQDEHWLSGLAVSTVTQLAEPSITQHLQYGISLSNFTLLSGILKYIVFHETFLQPLLYFISDVTLARSVIYFTVFYLYFSGSELVKYDIINAKKHAFHTYFLVCQQTLNCVSHCLDKQSVTIDESHVSSTSKA